MACLESDVNETGITPRSIRKLKSFTVCISFFCWVYFGLFSLLQTLNKKRKKNSGLRNVFSPLHISSDSVNSRRCDDTLQSQYDSFKFKAFFKIIISFDR